VCFRTMHVSSLEARTRGVTSWHDLIVFPRASSSRALNIPRIGILCAAFKILNVNDDGGAGCAGISAIFH